MGSLTHFGVCFYPLLNFPGGKSPISGPEIFRGFFRGNLQEPNKLGLDKEELLEVSYFGGDSNFYSACIKQYFVIAGLLCYLSQDEF